MLPACLEWPAAIGSLVGCLVSLIVLAVAKGAQRAANEARRAVTMQTMAETFARQAAAANRLWVALQDEDVGAASVLASQLSLGLREAQERWRAVVTADALRTLIAASARFDGLAEALYAGRRTPTRDDLLSTWRGNAARGRHMMARLAGLAKAQAEARP